MTAVAKRAQRLNDHHALEGEGAGTRIANEVDQLLKETASIRDLTDGIQEQLDTGGGSGGLWRRKKGVTNATTDPYVINPTVDPPGTCFDDVEAAATTQINLPTVAQIQAAGVDLETEIPLYRFVNTSNQIQRIKAAEGSTLNVDESTESADGGTVDMITRGSVLEVGLFDDQWRAMKVCGSWEIDA